MDKPTYRPPLSLLLIGVMIWSAIIFGVFYFKKSAAPPIPAGFTHFTPTQGK